MTLLIFASFQNLTSGFSNALFGYFEEGKFSEDVVLFRIYNESTKHMTDRKQEGKTMQGSYSSNNLFIIHIYVILAVYPSTIANHISSEMEILYHTRYGPRQANLVLIAYAIRAVSPEPSRLAHTSSESRGTFRQKARPLAPLNGWACAVTICHDGMLEDTNSLDEAHMNIPDSVLLSLFMSSYYKCDTAHAP